MEDRENFRKPAYLLRPRHTDVSTAERIRIAQSSSLQARKVPVSLSVPPWQEGDE